MGRGVIRKKGSADVPVPAGFVTPIGPESAPAGTVAVIFIDELTVKLVAATPPNVTLVVPPKLLPLIADLQQAYAPAAIVPISALKNSGTEQLVKVLTGLAPEGDAQFDADDITDRSERFLAAERVCVGWLETILAQFFDNCVVSKHDLGRVEAAIASTRRLIS